INSKIVLKIDTEGAEDKIIDDLIREGVLDKVDLIMGEIHLDTSDLDSKLVGFKEINKVYHTKNIYSFCYVREELYNELPLSKFS
ncbi:MAG: FkbM family methyltransferase, partial [Methanobacterium paludis]|nr:FkbM family methyltransferase [Methanobacterium paludis]